MQYTIFFNNEIDLPIFFYKFTILLTFFDISSSIV